MCNGDDTSAAAAAVGTLQGIAGNRNPGADTHCRNIATRIPSRNMKMELASADEVGEKTMLESEYPGC